MLRKNIPHCGDIFFTATKHGSGQDVVERLTDLSFLRSLQTRVNGKQWISFFLEPLV